MENAADALKMAAAVLIFVLALSISINAFGEARKASQIILDYNDREYDYTYVEENKDDDGNILEERIVGLETIVPSIYRAYKENYKIVFKFNNNTDYLYEKDDMLINYIDLEKEVLGSDTQREEFIKGILYGGETPGFLTNLGITLNSEGEGLYNKIKEGKYKFIESLGVYYQEEVNGGESTPDANKTKKRVITYTQK